jgi:hypothetical protein
VFKKFNKKCGSNPQIMKSSSKRKLTMFRDYSKYSMKFLLMQLIVIAEIQRPMKSELALIKKKEKFLFGIMVLEFHVKFIPKKKSTFLR